MNLPKSIKVYVRKSDIRRGCSTRDIGKGTYAENCPIARALYRKTGMVFSVGTLATTRMGTKQVAYALPDLAIKWISRFDLAEDGFGAKPDPISFEIYRRD